MAYSTLKAAIQAVIKQNGNNEITGPILQQALLSMINSLGDGYQFKGVATPATNPGTPDQNVFYIASEVGTYSNFGLSVGENEVAVFLWDGSWSKQLTGAASAEVVNQLGLEVANVEGGEISPDLQLEQGAIASATGLDTTSYTRIRTANYIKADVISVTTSGNKVYVMGYKNDGTFVAAQGWITESQDVTISGADKYRLVFAYSNDAAIAPTDYNLLGVTVVAGYNGTMATKEAQDIIKERVEMLEEKIIVADSVTKTPQLHLDGVIVLNTITTTSDPSILYYVPVLAGLQIRFDFVFLSGYTRYGFTTQLPAAGVAVQDYDSAGSNITRITLVAPANGYAVISFNPNNLQSLSYTIEKIDIGRDVYEMKKEINGILYDGELSGNKSNLFDLNDVAPGESVVVTLDQTYAGGEIAFYDSENTLIYEHAFNSSSTVTVTIPANFHHCSAIYYPSWAHCLISKNTIDKRLLLLMNKYNELASMENLLFGKRIAYNGDSICESRTDPQGVSYNGGAYAKLIADTVEGTYSNRAVSGGILASEAPDGAPTRKVCTDIVNMPADADLVCFEGGINDYWLNVPLGTSSPSDMSGVYDETTLLGALDSIFYQATIKWVGKPIVFVMVHKIGSTYYSRNTAGYTFQEAHDAMMQVCKKWSIPVYDAFEHSGLNGENAVQNTNFFINGDKTHPNIAGYKKYYVRQLISLFSSLIPIA